MYRLILDWVKRTSTVPPSLAARGKRTAKPTDWARTR